MQSKVFWWNNKIIDLKNWTGCPQKLSKSGDQIVRAISNKMKSAEEVKI